MPSLASYYADSKVRAATFLSAVRQARLTEFLESDVEGTKARLAELDPALTRTLALAGVRKPPDAVERWLRVATVATLRAQAPDAVGDSPLSASATLQQAIESVLDDLSSKARTKKVRAQNFVRLALIWLIRERNLSIAEALPMLSKLRRGSANQTDAFLRREAGMLVMAAKPKDLVGLSLVADLFREQVRQMRGDRDEAVSALQLLQERVDALTADLATANEALGRYRFDLEDARREAAALTGEVSQLQQRNRLDAKERAGKTRVFLSQRLVPLLSDAVGALTSEPPHLGVVRDRIQSAVELVNRKLGENDE